MFLLIYWIFVKTPAPPAPRVFDAMPGVHDGKLCGEAYEQTITAFQPEGEPHPLRVVYSVRLT